MLSPQIVYMVWNAINDPLFGYLQDNSKVRCCSQRRLSILYGAPLYSLAFLLAWFPWQDYAPGAWLSGLHLTVALCAFDAMLTFVLLAQCSLFAEISSHHENRLRLIKYNQVRTLYTKHFPPSFFCLSFSYSIPFIPQVASLIGSSSVLFCGLVSNNMEDFAAFQAFTVLIAVLSCGCMVYTGFHSESRFDSKCSESDETETADLTSQQSPFSFAGFRTLTWQILTNREFQLFVAMNFFQVFMLAFFNNFTLIFAEHLIPPDVLPSLAKSIMYGAGFICPQVLSLSGLCYFDLILPSLLALKLRCESSVQTPECTNKEMLDDMLLCCS